MIHCEQCRVREMEIDTLRLAVDALRADLTRTSDQLDDSRSACDRWATRMMALERRLGLVRDIVEGRRPDLSGEPE